MRGVHSWRTVNVVVARFPIFVAASAALFALAVRAALLLFGGPAA